MRKQFSPVAGMRPCEQDRPTILAIHAHLDDVETLCAGTLALLAGREHRIVIATMTAAIAGRSNGTIRPKPWRPRSLRTNDFSAHARISER